MSDKLEDLTLLLSENKDVPGEEVEHFIKECLVTESERPTRNIIIYWVYLHWVASKAASPLDRNIFFKRFKKYFAPASRDRARRYYCTSPHFKLNQEELAKAKKECQYERGRYAHQRSARKSLKIINEQHHEARQKNLTKASAVLKKLRSGT